MANGIKMISNLNVLAVIPARGGSKGVPLKNLRKVGGVPIVELAARVASKVDIIDKIVVSTDHDKIAESAVKGGALAPFVRPGNLSGDRVSDVEVLSHALKEMERIDKKIYDIVVMLQPTSPLRESAHVYDTIYKLVDENWDSVWTVSETESKSHPFKQLNVIDGRMDYYDNKGSKITARQQLSPVYHRNGIAYAIKRDCILKNNSIKGDRSGALIVAGDHISIDTEFDIELINNFFLNKS